MNANEEMAQAGESKKKQYPHEPYTPEWSRKALQLKFSMAPTIYPCAKCGAPVIDGYCCDFCHTHDPRSATED